jgi:glycerophosphoryl diester phosphodiesterase
VYFNIETKVEAGEPERSAAPQEYVDAILDAADAAGTTDRITVQSFDWSTLPLVRDRAPQVPLAALWDKSTWRSDSPYLGPVDYDAVDGDVLAGVGELGVEVASPAFDTSSSWVGGDLAGFIDRAHEAGVRVLPWTVNETADMAEYIDAGADGIITDYPSRLKELLDERGIAYRR